MSSLDPVEFLYVSIVIVVSYAIRGSTGFGAAAVPLLALVLPIKIIAPTVTLLGLISSCAIVAKDRQYIVWHSIWRVMPYCVVGVLAGLYMFATLGTETLSRTLGVFAMGYGAYVLATLSRTASLFPLRKGVVTALAGTVGGCVGTLFGTGGMFFAIYFDLLKFEKHQFRATIASALFALGALRAIGYASVGAISVDTLAVFAVAVPFMAAGIYLGNRIHASVSQLAFKRLVGIVMIASGIPLIVR